MLLLWLSRARKWQALGMIISPLLCPHTSTHTTSTPASYHASQASILDHSRFIAFTPCSILPSHPQHNTATSHDAARPCQAPAWRGRRGGWQRRRPRHQGPKHGRAASFFQVSGGPAGVITSQGVLASVSRCLPRPGRYGDLTLVLLHHTTPHRSSPLSQYGGVHGTRATQVCLFFLPSSCRAVCMCL